ncbi:JAB domain-containing protein [Halobellus sp. EA9]|uniref:JAB domain-containing protein n=1 Tax=Halobellus sp. EA9 TaxID=3421647 RepID=UPI003EBB596F
MKYEFGTITVQAEICEDQNQQIKTKSDVLERYGSLQDEVKERLYAVFLTRSNRFIGDKLVSLGSQGATQFDAPDVIRTASLVNAGAVILVHNHPSGDPTPSKTDIERTEQLYNTLENLGIDLLDHVIIAPNNAHSMKQEQNGPYQPS